MATNTSGGTTTSFMNTPQAVDDYYAVYEDCIYSFDVMCNDLGGNAKILWSIDDSTLDGTTGITASGDGTYDLLSKDAACVPELSDKGARIWIDSGKIKYDASVFNYLGAGESVCDKFTYAIRMSNGTLSWATVTITISGTNDGPDIRVGSGDTGSAGLNETNAGLCKTGTLTVTDPDTSDTISTTIALTSATGPTGGPSNATLQSMLSVTPASGLAANTGDANNLTWKFDSGSEAFNYLRAGQTLQLVYTLTVSDGHGGTDTQTVAITITGTNDAPVLSDTTDPSAVLEAGDASAQNLSVITGNFSVTDLDNGDTLDASVVGGATVLLNGNPFVLPAGASALTAAGAFSVTDTVSNGGAVNIGYSYDPGAANLDFLGAGESLTITYTVQVNDGTTNSGTQNVTVTITGTNDAPVVSGAVLATVDEDASNPASVDLLANASDPDRTDDVDTASVGYSVTSGTWVPAVSYSVDNETGALTFDPNQFNALGASESIELTFTYNVVDGNGGSTPATAVVTITGSNDAPVVSGAVLATVDEDASNPASVDLLANASDPDRTDDVDTASVGYSVTSGTWVPAVSYSVDNETGALTFDPNQFNALGASESIELTFTYNVVDGNGGSTPATAVVTITGSNDAPVVSGAVLATVDEDASNPASVDLLANASDPDRTDDVDTASVGYSVTSGTWVPAVSYSVDNETGALTFDPNQFNALGASESIELTFTYNVVDGNGGSTPATAVVTITGSNDAPVVSGAVLATVDEDASNPASVDLLANASDPDRTDDVDTASVGYSVTSGTWVPAVSYSVDNETGALTFDPNQFNALGASESIELTFTYNVVDGNGGSTPATAVVTITGSNDAPVVSGAVLATVDEDASNPASVDLLANASDPDRTDDVDTASVGYSVTSGTWVPAVSYSVDNETGALTFDPNQFNALGASESIELTFTYNVVDGNGGSTPATAVVTITGSNDAPVVSGAVLATVDEDASNPASVDLLANASDPDRTDDVDTASVGYSVTSGTWVPAVSYSVDNETGALTFDPNQFNALGASESIELTFTYNVVDGNGGSTPATAVVTITGSNDAPVVSGAVLATVDEDASNPASVDLLANASDPDRTDDVDTASVGYSVTSGTWVPAVSYSVDNETGALTFDPNQFNALGASESIELTFTYNVVDGNGGSTPATAVVTITGSNDAPVVSGAVLATVDEDASNPASVDLLANASDPDRTDDVDTASVGYSVTSGTWVPAVSYSVDNETGALTFDPNQFNALGASESIELTFTYNVVDGNGGSTPATAVVTITGSNDAPVVSGAVLATVDEDASNPASVDLLANASDPDRTDDVDTASVGYSVTSGTWVPAVSYSVDNETGALTFDPNQFNALGASESIELTFTYNVVDGNGGSTPATAVVTITGSNDAPVVSGAVLATVDEDASNPASVDLLANASDPDRTDDVDTASVGYSVTSGTWVPAVSYSVDNETGALTFDPNQFNALGASESIELTFTYNVVDGNGGSTPATAVVTITGSNDAPVVSGAVLATVDEDASNPASVDLLANASDPDRTDDVDTASVGYSVTSGTWVPAVSYSVDNETGALTFDPNQFNALGASESIELTFTYNVVDGNGGSTPATAVVTITGSNDAPVVSGAVLATVDEDASNPASVDLLANASDPDRTDDVDTASVGYSVTSGTWVPAVSYSVDNETGALTFDPNQFNALGASESIELTFTYNVVDGNGGSTPATAVVTITGSNDAPVVTGDLAAPISEGSTYQLTTADVNFTDPDDGASEVSFTVSGLSNGTLYVNGIAATSFTGQQLADGLVTFTHDGSETLTAGFNISVEDGNEDSSAPVAQTFNFTVSPVNDAPINTVPGGQSVNEDQTLVFSNGNGNAISISDVDAGSNTVQVTLSVAGGTLTLGSLVGLTVTAGANGSSTVTVQGTQAAINAGLQGLTYQGNLNFNGGDSLSVVTSDLGNSGSGGTLTDSDSVAITVNAVNDAPVNNLPAGFSTNEDTALKLAGISVTDVDSGAGNINVTLSVATGTLTAANAGGVTVSGSGTASIVLSGTLSAINAYLATVANQPSFNPVANTSGNVTLTMTTSDLGNSGSGGTLTDTDNRTVTVIAVNDNPVTTNDVIWASNNTAVTLSWDALLGNDTDQDGLALTLQSVVVTTGTLATPVTVNSNGTFSFTTGAAGGTVAAPTTVTLTYTTIDGLGGSSTGTVTLRVVGVDTGGSNQDPIDLSVLAAGSYQASFINGNQAADTLTDGTGLGTLVGGAGADILTGNNGNDLLIGGAANDTLSGGAGNDILRGGDGNNDDMDGGAGTEDLLDFSDATAAIGTVGTPFTLVQSAANTSIPNGTGGLGNNDVYRNMEGVIGSSQADFITGSSGNDILRGGAGNDTLNGAAGTQDYIDFRDGTAGLTFTLTQSGAGTAFNASGAGLGTDTYSNMEGVIGTNFADNLTGSSGNDFIRGEGGNDVINGGAGNDTITGGTGADTLTGGIGNDIFVFNSPLNAVDTITDFEANGADQIQLDDAIFAVLSPGALSAANFVSNSGGVAGDANDFILFDSDTGNLYYDADGNGAGQRILIANVTVTAGTIDPTDILIV